MKIKICGIKNLEEARGVCECEFKSQKVDFIGVIFAKSKRKVSKEMAKDIARLAHKFGIKVVGVFADMALDEVSEISKFTDIDIIQIYSNIPDKRKFDKEIWQVFSVGESLPDLGGSYDLALFDTKGVLKGGNGVKFEWNLLENLDIKFGLAGGIGVQNVKSAMKFKPYLLDINSLVEDENGLKIPEKIYEILKIVKG